MKKKYFKNNTAILIALLIILFACKKTNDIQSTPGTGNGSVQGVITDLNNSPVSNATVTGGTATATTDASGKFTLTKVQFTADTVVVTATKNGFFEGSKKFAASNNAVSNAKIQLIPKSVSGSFTATSGGNVTIAGGGSVNFGSGFVTASNGNAYTGNVSVSAHYLDPADQNFSAYAPGELKAAGANNQQGTLQSFGVVAVEMNDAAGNKLQLASGKTATITIPIPSTLQSSAPSSTPLWYFDVTKGAWKQEGSATKQGSNYIGVVNHFTFWNVGDIAGSVVNLSATFIDSISGTPFANKLVTITRPDSSSKNSYTDNSGKVSGLVPANEVLNMKVFDTCGAIVYLKDIGPFSTDTDLGNIYVRNCNQSTVAGFTYFVSGSVAPVTVSFLDISSNATGWIWDFGDGGTSTVQNPVHTYSTAGDYTVTLIASGAGGKKDSTSQILHLLNQPTVAGFTYSVSSGSIASNVHLTVGFLDTSTNATSWVWYFGDGTTSTVQNPVHTYSTAGDYTVTLIASGAVNTDSTFQILHLVNIANDTYINLTLNGTNYSWAPPDRISGSYIVYYSGGTLLKQTNIEGYKNGNAAGIYIKNGNATSPGNYNGSVGFEINGKFYAHNGFITTPVTEYGAVGGYITGSASGQVFANSDTATKFPFSLQYKVTRIQ
ncbi:PKD domain-containing protein [Terrimonas pollutisoli]|uniref:PKD domain-containing protein n=1 Tax=Terrimonas pollutisoli TaxID=3034147 RepID=UPI0023ECF8E6|nr:PKD domain-containing protein [Terrimonas sp. H1YJ31]